MKIFSADLGLKIRQQKKIAALANLGGLPSLGFWPFLVIGDKRLLARRTLKSATKMPKIIKTLTSQQSTSFI